MDRNCYAVFCHFGGAKVALRKESVDRNVAYLATSAKLPASLSARRAWIEIVMPFFAILQPESLSARRAWIEMLVPTNNSTHTPGRSPQGERG